MALNPNWKRTYKVSRLISLVKSDGVPWISSSSDPHPPIGNEVGSTRVARAEGHFTVPDLPASGRLVDAYLTIHEYGGSAHPNYQGSSKRAWVRRINEAPDGDNPSSTSGVAITFGVNGSERHNVAAMVEEMLPGRIKRKSDPDVACGNSSVKFWFQFRSGSSGDSDGEDDDARSFVMTDDIYLTLEIKDSTTPDAPEIVEVLGGQDDPDNDRTVVGSADGRTLSVVFGFRGAAGDTCSKAELALHVEAGTDDFPNTVIKTTGNIPVTRTGAAGQYRITLSGIPSGSEGRFRIRTTSQKNQQGDWSSLEDDTAHVLLAVTPGAPKDIVFQPFTSQPHILFSLDSPDSTDYLTRGEAEVTLLPQGTPAVSLNEEVAHTRRADLDTGHDFADGQEVSYRVRGTNAAGLTGAWSPVLRQVLRESQDPTISPDPGRLTSKEPTLTLSFPTADGARLRLIDPVDDERELYDSGGIVLVDQTSHDFDIPAGVLTYGQKFRAVPSYRPDGSPDFLPEADPIPYSVASLASISLSVPEAVSGKVGDQTPEWVRTVTDPDGGAIGLIAQSFYEAATPQGSGAFIHQFVDGGQLGPVAIPGIDIDWETGVDSIATVSNDIDPLASTTLNGAISIGAVSAVITSATGFETGQDVYFASAISGEAEVRRVTVTGTTLTWPTSPPLEHAHGNGQVVSARVFGPLSQWVTITALQPPDVDLISPINGATVADPTRTLDWSVTGYGGRTQESAVVGIYLAADGSLVAALDVDDSTTSTDIPAFLLDTATSYLWDVTVTDTGGMVTTSASRTIHAVFAEPLPINVLEAVADPVTGAVVLTWDPGDEPYPDNYEVTWTADDGSPVRIEGGPEALLDGNDPFVGGSLIHIGARLGVNTYFVAVSNGWRSSEPVSVTVTLTVDHPAFSWLVVADGPETLALDMSSGSMAHSPTVERMQPPGGKPRQITWGMEPRSWSLGFQNIPSEDPILLPTLRRWAGAGTGFWVKSPLGYRVDPIWVAAQSLNATPSAFGILEHSMDVAELGDPVHAILLPPATAPDEGEGNIYTTVDGLDFGTIEEI